MKYAANVNVRAVVSAPPILYQYGMHEGEIQKCQKFVEAKFGSRLRILGS
jgi:hypothetical protein